METIATALRESEYLIPLIVLLPFILFWLWMITDAYKRNLTLKPVWLVMFFLGHIPVAIIYYIVIYKNQVEPLRTSVIKTAANLLDEIEKHRK
jgi:hypothetical protein